MESAASRTCPVCSTALGVVHHEGVELDRCPVGHGVWLDRGELRLVVASEDAPRPEHEAIQAHEAAIRDAGHAVVAESARPPRPCPVCGRSMRLTEYAASGIPIDECHEHGVWLDGGELERIEAYAEGVRRHARTGAAVAPRTDGGIDIPDHLLATIRTIGAPPPHASA
jgi:Zn-finger nucleic acid-binding protein